MSLAKLIGKRKSNKRKINGGSMKKILVSLMLVIGMFAFAAESDPSATVGYVKYSNVANMNFMALPVDAGYGTVDEFDPTGTNINSINNWNSSTQSWDTASKGLFGWSGQYDAEVGQPYWVNGVQAHDFIMDGPVVDIPAYNLVTNMNGIMVPLTKSALTTAQAVGNDMVNCNAINGWDQGTQQWNTISKGLFGWNGDFNVGIADPLWVNLTANTTWPSAKTIDYVAGDDMAPKSSPKAIPKIVAYAVEDLNGDVYADNPATANVTFKFWITARPGDVLNEQSAGCSFQFYFVTGSVVANLQDFADNYTDGETLRFWVKDEDQVPPMEGIADVVLAGGATEQDLGYNAWMPGTGDPISLSTPSSVEDGMLPTVTKLHQNYPNPFNPTTTIKFDLSSNTDVKLNVYNYNGQMVKSLVSGQMNAGYHTVNFDASNLSAGVYYYTLEANNKVMTNKMVLVK
jgi:hypothetical protein